MRSVHLSALTVLALGALAPSAFAAQTFSFANPFASGGASYMNSQFETVGVPTTPSATLESFYKGTVKLVVTGGSTAGTYLANYSILDASGSPILDLTSNPSGTYTINDAGTLKFTYAGPTGGGLTNGQNLLTFNFGTGGIASTSGFGISPAKNSFVTSTTGSLVDGPVDNSKTKFSFSFPGSFLGGGDTRHYTADFTSSVQAVPEPASMGVLAIGAVALLRRRRRA